MNVGDYAVVPVYGEGYIPYKSPQQRAKGMSITDHALAQATWVGPNCVAFVSCDTQRVSFKRWPGEFTPIDLSLRERYTVIDPPEWWADRERRVFDLA